MDDAILTGATARAAIEALERRRPAKVVLAAPVVSRDLVNVFREIVSDVVCVETPPFVSSVVEWYADARQVPEEENVRLIGSFLDERLRGARAAGGR